MTFNEWVHSCPISDDFIGALILGLAIGFMIGVMVKPLGYPK